MDDAANTEPADARPPMTGAEAMLRTLAAGGVDVLFANPGTSELLTVAALDRVEGVRGVLTLFEGVATGAADGYARMAGKPAATLLHLGPGLANGLANLHNAAKASSPVVSIVGDHATYHRSFDAPLTSDIETAAKSVSAWLRTSTSSGHLAQDTADAIAAARKPPGGVASLIVPADAAWGMAEGPSAPRVAVAPRKADPAAITAAARSLRAEGSKLLFLGGDALTAEALDLAGRIAAATGSRLLAETFNRRFERGAGVVPVECLPYPVGMALATLVNVQEIVLVGSRPPVAFFAYPDKPSMLTPAGIGIESLSGRSDDPIDALTLLAEELRVGAEPARVAELLPPPPPTGALNGAAIGQSLAALIPENAIVVDESVTTGFFFQAATRNARRHTWLQSMGGSIGFGMPAAIGAAVACPDRPVINLQADGSAMYTLQALWTEAREGLKVITVILDNRRYAILGLELANVGVRDPGPATTDMIEIDRPALDFAALAAGMGVPAIRVDTAEAFHAAFARALASDGPCLIDAVLG